MPFNGGRNTEYLSVQLSADVIADVKLLSKMLDTAAGWSASVRYDTRNQGVTQLWVDFAGLTPIKKKPMKSYWFSLFNTELGIFLLLAVLFFYTVYFDFIPLRMPFQHIEN
jgi:hypothetical protein